MISTEDVNTIKEGICRVSLDADAEVKANAGKSLLPLSFMKMLMLCITL